MFSSYGSHRPALLRGGKRKKKRMANPVAVASGHHRPRPDASSIAAPSTPGVAGPRGTGCESSASAVADSRSSAVSACACKVDSLWLKTRIPY
jgi:hypothetical protein